MSLPCWLRGRLRTALVCTMLEAGVIVGVPMRPQEIEELLHTMNQPKVSHVLRVGQQRHPTLARWLHGARRRPLPVPLDNADEERACQPNEQAPQIEGDVGRRVHVISLRGSATRASSRQGDLRIAEVSRGA